MDEDEQFVDVDQSVEEQEHQALMAAASSHQHPAFSIYEPHYEQMHPLIYFEDPNHHQHHHQHHQLTQHHPHLHHLSHPQSFCPTGADQLSQELANATQQQHHQQHSSSSSLVRTATRAEPAAGRRHQGAGDSDSPEREAQASESPVQVDSPSAATNRELHNEIERKRRFRIKQCCDILRTLVPGLNDRTDKASVLEHTVKFVNHLMQCPDFRCNCDF